MTAPHIIDLVNDRLEALNQYHILDTLPEEEYDDIVELAANICNTACATISFLDHNKSWFKAKIGLDIDEIPSENSFCTSNWYLENFIEIKDTHSDVRFHNNPISKGKNGIRFFAGVPIKSGNRVTIGHLCVLDHKSGTLSPKQINWMHRLGRQVEGLLKTRRKKNLTQKKSEKEEALQPINDLTIIENNSVSNKLNKQKAFYEDILNSIPTDIVAFDNDHRYLFVNPGAIGNEEYRKFIIGKDDFEYAEYRNWDVSLPEKRRKKFIEVKNNKKEIRWEDNMKDLNGNPVTHLRRLFPVLSENKELQYVIGFGIDITERKLLEETLVKKILDQNKQLIDFCNIVSHNLRGPLINLSVLTQYIEESTDDIERRQMIGMLNPVIENLNQTFNELVESIQIKHDHEVKSEILMLKKHLGYSTIEFEKEIKKSKATVEVDFGSAQQIFFPSKYLDNIFFHLISNALKFKSPDRDPVIKLKTKKQVNSIILTISDNGSGLDVEKNKDNLFKIGKVFHRNPNAKGIGLFMIKTQIEAMGGSIWMESTPEIGSTFFIEFKNQYL